MAIKLSRDLKQQTTTPEGTGTSKGFDISGTPGVNYDIEKIERSKDRKDPGAELLAELSKKPGEQADYFENDRAYRTEENVFEHFSDEEIVKYFGNPPRTVFENMSALDLYPEKLNILKRNNVINDKQYTNNS